MEQMNTGDNQHMGARERISSLGKEWNALSEAEKEVWTHWTSLGLRKLIIMSVL
jgi:hypothetical protein